MWNPFKSQWKKDDKISDFIVIASAGSGAFGETIIVKDVTGKVLALKILNSNSDSSSKREFEGIVNLRKIGKGLGVAQVFHAGFLPDGRFYYTMEAADNLSVFPEYYADTLEHRLERFGALNPSDCIELAKNLLLGIETLHKAGLTHRDIKPSNIVFINEQAMLADFGLVSEQDKGKSLVGTLGFIPADEIAHVLSGYSAPQNDFYALGKVLYCAWTNLSVEEYPKIPKDYSLRDLSVMRSIYNKACNDKASKRFKNITEFYNALYYARQCIDKGIIIFSRKQKIKKYVFFSVISIMAILPILLGLYYWGFIRLHDPIEKMLHRENDYKIIILEDGYTYRSGVSNIYNLNDLQYIITAPIYRNYAEKKVIDSAYDISDPYIASYEELGKEKEKKIKDALRRGRTLSDSFDERGKANFYYIADVEKLKQKSNLVKLRVLLDDIAISKSNIQKSIDKKEELITISYYLELRKKIHNILAIMREDVSLSCSQENKLWLS